MSPLIQNLLKVEATDHRKIQEETQKNLENLGYEVKLEKKIRAGRQGKIDVFAQKGDFSVGIEVDHSQIRKKSIKKLNALKPSLAIFLLKGKYINRKATYSRAKLIRVNSLLVYLPAKKVEKIGPRFSECKQEETPVTKPRYKQFEKVETLPKFRIIETDLKILRELADYRFLDTKQISVLHPELSERETRRRLQFLFRAGFLARPSQQFSLFCLISSNNSCKAGRLLLARYNSVNFFDF